MGGKNKAPPPPDYGPIAQASKEAAEVSAAVAREQLAWAREQYAMDREVSDTVVADALKRADEQDALARQDRSRYETLFQPLENQLVEEATSYNSEGRREYEAGRAQADVSQQFDAARTNAMAELESYGIDPTQTRAGALDVSIRTQEAAARAGAGNLSRERTAQTGRGLRSEAINIGRGLPGQAAQSLNAAIQSGNQAVNSGNATTATGAQTMGTGVQWQGQSNAALGTWGNTLNMGYQNQLAANKQNQDNSSGLGSALGLIGGLATKFLPFSDERVKDNITPVGKTDDGQTIYRFQYKDDPEDVWQMGLMAQEVEKVHPDAVYENEQGVKMVDYERALPVDSATSPTGPKMRYAEGGAVPATHSPSGGKAIDDVDARLTAGEFVIPADVVRYKGEEFFNKLLVKSKQMREQVQRPEYRALPA
jgi:hypothetical protein